MFVNIALLLAPNESSMLNSNIGILIMYINLVNTP